MRKAADAEVHSAHSSVNRAVAEIANTANPVSDAAASTEVRDGH
jgi:hypothetical protein